MSGRARPPTRLEYQLVLNFVTGLFGGYFLSVTLYSLHDTDGVSSGQIAAWPEYRLKRSITFYATVGSCSNLYRSFWRLFSLASQWNCYSTHPGSRRARPPTRQVYRLKMSITLDPTVGPCSNFYRSFRRLFLLASYWNRYSTPPTSGRARPPTRLEYWLKRSLTLDPTVGSCSIFTGVFEGCFPCHRNKIATRHP